MFKEKLLTLFSEMERDQRNKLLNCGAQFVPHLTPDDILQPNDFPELEYNPHFRYEEGILQGILACRAAFLAIKED